MRAIYHRNTGEEEHVNVLDIFVDGEGVAKVLFIGVNDQITTAPINRFTDYEGEKRESGNLDQGKGMDNYSI